MNGAQIMHQRHFYDLGHVQALFASKKGLDVTKVIKMSLVHDLCTIHSGDVTPYDNLVTGDFEKDTAVLAHWPRRAKEEKERLTQERRVREEEALDKLTHNLPQDFASEIKDLWSEYE